MNGSSTEDQKMVKPNANGPSETMLLQNLGWDSYSRWQCCCCSNKSETWQALPFWYRCPQRVLVSQVQLCYLVLRNRIPPSDLALLKLQTQVQTHTSFVPHSHFAVLLASASPNNRVCPKAWTHIVGRGSQAERYFVTLVVFFFFLSPKERSLNTGARERAFLTVSSLAFIFSLLHVPYRLNKLWSGIG